MVEASSFESFTRQVLQAGLPGVATTPETSLEVAHVHWLARHRLTGFGRALIVAGHPIIDEARVELEQAWQRAERVAESSRAVALQVGELLDRQGVDWMTVKGVALTSRDYPPGVRHFVDADIVVRSEQFGPALDVLDRAGFRDPYPSRHRRLEPVFAVAVHRHRAGGQADIHRIVVRPPIGERVSGPLFERRERGHDEIWTLDGVGRALHASLTLLLGDPTPRLVQHRDVVQVLQRVEVGAVLDAADRLGVGGLVDLAIETAHQTVGLDGPERAASPIPWLDVLAVRVARSSRHSSEHALRLLTTRGLRRRAQFARYVLGSREWAEFSGSRVQRRANDVLERLGSP